MRRRDAVDTSAKGQAIRHFERELWHAEGALKNWSAPRDTGHEERRQERIRMVDEWTEIVRMLKELLAREARQNERR